MGVLYKTASTCMHILSKLISMHTLQLTTRADYFLFLLTSFAVFTFFFAETIRTLSTDGIWCSERLNLRTEVIKNNKLF